MQFISKRAYLLYKVRPFSSTAFSVNLKEVILFSSEHWEGITTDWWKMLLLLVGVIAIIVVAILIVTAVCKRKGIKLERSTKDLTYGAICLAASYALSFISLFTMPNGGTITPASALPLLIYCYYFGFRKSSVVCAAYMILQLIQKPYIVSPWSALLDYFVPFFAISFVGIFCFSPARYNKTLMAQKPLITAHWKFFVGVIVYFVIRYASHTLAGALYWSNNIGFLIWSGDLSGIVALSYSATYNLFFLLPDTIIAAAAGAALLSSKTFNRFMTSSTNAFKNTNTTAKDDQGAGASAYKG